MSNDNKSNASDDILTQIVEILWGYREELTCVLSPVLAFVIFDHKFGTITAGLLTVLLIVIAFGVPPLRRGIAYWLRLGRWRRKLCRAINSQQDSLRFRCPVLEDVQKTPSGWRLVLKLRSGTSHKELDAVIPYLESHFGIERVIVHSLPNNKSRFELILRLRSSFEGRIAVPVSPKSTLSGWDPIPIGVDEDGVQVKLMLFEHNLLIGGEPGSGKSSLLQVIASTAVLDEHSQVHLLDPKHVEFASYAGIADSVSHSQIEAIECLRFILHSAHTRYQALRNARLRKWTKEHGSLIYLIVDELPIFINAPDSKEAKQFTMLLREIVALGRAAGVVTILAAQKPSVDSVPSGIRDLIDYRLAFRCATREASDVILGRGSATQGYSASDIGTRDQGVGLLLGDDSVPRLIKGYYLDDNAVADRLANAQIMRKALGDKL